MRAVKSTATDRLLRAAASRIQAAAFAGRTRVAAIVLSAVLLIALLCARLLAVLPNGWFTPLTLFAVPVLAVAAAAAFVRRPSPAQVARALDERADGKELFLTTALIGESPGEYRGIVLAQAEERASELHAARMFPVNWLPVVRDTAAALGILTAATLWLPKLDPFAMEEKRRELAKEEQRLAETKKLTAVRKEELKEKSGVLSEQVKQALTQMEKALKEAKPQEREANAKKLAEAAKDLSDLWRKAAANVPRDALDKAAQQFGDNRQREAVKDMIDKLRKGDSAALSRAMEKLRQQMQDAAKLPDGAAKQEKLEQLARELGQMANQLREQLGDKSLNESLARAAEQLDLSKRPDISKEALDAAAESLGLSAEEMKRLAESFKDMEMTGEALKALAAAKQLNDQGKLDGKDAQGGGQDGPSDLEKLQRDLSKKLAEGGDSADSDSGTPGTGTDGGGSRKKVTGDPFEDDTGSKDFKKERSRSLVGAGKFLMEWKAQGVGDAGAKGSYDDAVRTVRDAAAEAIRSEQVPPGYHGVIQKYFDNLSPKPR